MSFLAERETIATARNRKSCQDFEVSMVSLVSLVSFLRVRNMRTQKRAIGLGWNKLTKLTGHS